MLDQDTRMAATAEDPSRHDGAGHDARESGARAPDPRAPDRRELDPWELDPRELDAAVEAEEVRLLVRGRVAIPVNLLNAGLVGAVLWPLYPAWVVTGWLGLFCLVILGRFVMRRRYLAAPAGTAPTGPWRRAFVASAFATGCMWGLSGLTVLLTTAPVYQVFIVFVLGGMMVGGIVANAASRPAMLAFMIPTTLPATIALLTRPGHIQVEMGLMLAVFSAVTLLSGLGIHRAIAENLRLLLRQQALLERVRRGEAAAALLATIVEASDDAIAAQALDGTILSWNRGAEKVLGYRADEAIGRSVRMLFPPALKDVLEPKLAGLAEGRRFEPFDTRLARKDGSLVPVSVAVSLTRDAAGEPVGASYIVRDISEREAAARAVTERDRLLHAVTMSTRILVQAASLEQGMPEALRILGETMGVDRLFVMRRTFDASGAVGAPTLSYVWEAPGMSMGLTQDSFAMAPAEKAIANAWVERLMARKTVINHRAGAEEPLRGLLTRLNIESTALVPIFVGERYWGALVVDTSRVAREWSENDLDMLNTFGEIAGSLLAQGETRQSLERSEARFRALTGAAQDAIITLGPTGQIAMWNVAAERLLGYAAEEAVGRQVHELIAPERFRAKADPGLAHFLATGEGEVVGKTTLLAARRKDGSEITVELSLSGAQVEGGWEAIGIMRDITERQAVEDRLRFANILLNSEMEASPYGIMVVAPDRKILMANDRFSRMWNIAQAEVVGTDLTEALRRASPLFSDPVAFTAQVKHLFDHPEEDSTTEYVLTDGRSIHREIATLSSADGEPLGRVWYFRDVTEERESERRLAFTSLLLRTEMEASLDAMLVVNQDRKIISFNRRFAEIWGVPMEDLTRAEDDVVLAKVTATIKDTDAFVKKVMYLYDHPGEDSRDEYELNDGRFIDRHTVTLYSPSQEYLGRIWFFRDITDQKRAEAAVLRMARLDVLTGLGNRAVFVEALAHAIAAANRGENGFALLYLDLDHFKDVNDTLGHPVGDELLKAVADRLRANTRETDTLARFGGDEFAVIVSDVRQPADAALMADKLTKALGRPFSIDGSDVHSGASVGIAIYGTDAPDAETLLANADVALYRAKSEGRGSYRFFTEAMDTEVQTRVALGVELRAAVEDGQLFLLYQPQVSIDGGQITGVEALVRWRHPTRGVLGPDLFIPIAEQIGIISRLGHWVLWEACRQGRRWLDAGIPPVRISINVSALQFRTPLALEADIFAALAETRLPAHLLELEMTEEVLMDAARQHSDLLQRLRNTGVTVAIDDFGTGYSSLDYLRRFPSNRIKIAQNFVTRLGVARGLPPATHGDAAIVRATIGLARELQIPVIAEGVETQEQCDLLEKWGCGEVQGYHYARPLAVEDATEALRKGNIVPL